MKNRKSIILLLLVAIIGVVGLTVAYFTNTATIENEFQTNSYGTTVEEVFTSPDNWTPGTTTPKTLTVTNSGNLDEAVRVEVMESWMSKNGDPLPLKQNGNDAAIINWANSSDWTKVTENNKTYYYYNYKLAPTETTSELLNSVTFNPLITNDSDCETDTSVQGVKTVTCNSTGDGYDDATYTLTFKIETVQYDKYNEAWNLNNAVTIAEEKNDSEPVPVPQSGSEFLFNDAVNPVNVGYNDETKYKMFQFNHNGVSENRYIGDSPNNYVYFNCEVPVEILHDSGEFEQYCEKWRIIGTFTVEKTDPDDLNKKVREIRIKLVRGTLLSDIRSWGTEDGEYDYYGSEIINDWSLAPINNYLNQNYYFELSDSAKSQIENAYYYLGGIDSNDESTYYGTTDQIYEMERGTLTFGDFTPSEWEGLIGLMYPSDVFMTYAKGVNNTCYDDPFNCENGIPSASWIYNTNILQETSELTHTWFISPYSSLPNGVLVDVNNGSLRAAYSYGSCGVRPVVYLKSTVNIVGGTGEEENPYILE